jgi:hypothetical protein
MRKVPVLLVLDLIVKPGARRMLTEEALLPR